MRVIICTIILLLAVNSMTSFAEESSLFIGLIEDVDGHHIMVDDLFNLDIEANEDDKFIIDVTDIEPTAYPIGYLISIYFTEYTYENGTFVIKAKVLSAVEPNAEASICVEKETTELFIGKIMTSENGFVEVEPLFDLKNSYDESIQVFLDVNDLSETYDFEKNKIITIEYNGIEKKEDHHILHVYSITSIEDDHEVETTDDLSFFEKVVALFKLIFNL